MSVAADMRRKSIIEMLVCTGFVDVAALRKEFGCSEATVRRDLEQLDSEGKLRRTHGGAVLGHDTERPFRVKLGEMAEAKRRIAKSAADLVRDGDSVGFTGGTTTREVARALVSRSGLTVVTNAINIAMEFATCDARVIVTGGELRGQSFELVGALAEPVASQLHLDRIFVGVDGFSIKGGLTTHDPAEARINRVLINRAAHVIVVTDHTKIGKKTFAQIAPSEIVATLITDAEVDKQWLTEFEHSDIRVITA